MMVFPERPFSRSLSPMIIASELECSFAIAGFFVLFSATDRSATELLCFRPAFLPAETLLRILRVGSCESLHSNLNRCLIFKVRARSFSRTSVLLFRNAHISYHNFPGLSTPFLPFFSTGFPRGRVCGQRSLSEASQNFFLPII